MINERHKLTGHDIANWLGDRIKWFTDHLFELVVIIAILGVLVALLMPAIVAINKEMKRNQETISAPGEFEVGETVYIKITGAEGTVLRGLPYDFGMESKQYEIRHILPTGELATDTLCEYELTDKKPKEKRE